MSIFGDDYSSASALKRKLTTTRKCGLLISASLAASAVTVCAALLLWIALHPARW